MLRKTHWPRFERGIELEADFVEIDVRCTADGVLVALHDATVNRTTNGKGRVDSLSLGDQGARCGERGTYSDARTGAQDGCRTNRTDVGTQGRWRGPSDCAGGTEGSIGHPVIYASFLHDELIHVRAVETEAALMVLFDRLPRAPVAYAMQYQTRLRRSSARQSHRPARRRIPSRERVVWVYTANSLADIAHAISIGVDGVISNFPERIGKGRNA